MTQFADYIVFVDESGDHSLSSIDPEFPVFALTFCILETTSYVSWLVPEISRFKVRYWGHDTVILHEHEIRKEKGEFAFLRADRSLREAFLADLHHLMVDTPFGVIASVIDKVRLKERYVRPWNPYEISLQFCLERLLEFLVARGQNGRRVHVIFECRGKDEDGALELAFRRILAGQAGWGHRQPDFSRIDLAIRFAKKSENSPGLQLADLTARPIALRTLRPTQKNRAFDVIVGKLAVPIKEFP